MLVQTITRVYEIVLYSQSDREEKSLTEKRRTSLKNQPEEPACYFKQYQQTPKVVKVRISRAESFCSTSQFLAAVRILWQFRRPPPKKGKLGFVAQDFFFA